MMRAKAKDAIATAKQLQVSCELKIESVPVDFVRPNPRNARTHNRAQRRKIASSIRRLGIINPLIVDEANMILAGHGRLAAAKEEGFTHVPVVRISHLSEAEKRAYLIADNKIAEEAGWDRDMLAIELGELVELLPHEGFDVSITGFDTPEIDLLMADLGPRPNSSPDDDIPPLPSIPTTRSGDLWQLGKHSLLCGDARQENNFARLMNGTTAKAVFTDPPYNVRVRDIVGRGRIKHKEFACASGEMSKREYRAFLTKTLGNAIEVSAPSAIHFVCIDWRHIADLVEVGDEIFGDMLNLVVWNKSNPGQGSFYRSQHELIGVFRVGGGAHQNNVQLGRFGRNRSNVWNYAGANSFGKNRIETLALHPTVKPVALISDALIDCTNRGDTVLDQFAGSGSLFLAAEKVGRIGFGIEYEPVYVDVAIQRWQRLTKLDATLAGDGRTFDELLATGPHAREEKPPQSKPVPARTSRNKPRRQSQRDRKRGELDHG